MVITENDPDNIETIKKAISHFSTKELEDLLDHSEESWMVDHKKLEKINPGQLEKYTLETFKESMSLGDKRFNINCQLACLRLINEREEE